MAEQLTLRKSEWLDDWYVIERVHHDGRTWLEPMEGGGVALMCSSRLGNADIEGTSDHMRALAAAIDRHERESFKRCAVQPVEGGWHIWSPRNSIDPSIISDAQAQQLAGEIRRVLAEMAIEPHA